MSAGGVRVGGTAWTSGRDAAAADTAADSAANAAEAASCQRCAAALLQHGARRNGCHSGSPFTPNRAVRADGVQASEFDSLQKKEGLRR
ncbi:unnamed protein product [Nesidiocoris tenuis]|uniref:Uncharacterized protein n=1 Tax=Nesidiocoris tenuis TaxID=355587 RepID=A0A6H5H0E0_9HEMI|nr:unnamed protein product [Nesidiocoris tenuis]